MAAVPVAVADVRTVCCAGTGVIGGGWVAYFLAHGYDVVAWDPGPRRRGTVAPPRRRRLAGADRARALRGRRPLAAHLRARPREALAGAQFVQESAPEDLDLKRSCSPTSTPPRPRAS